MNKIKIDGIERDISELIRDKVKITGNDWKTDTDWLIIEDYSGEEIWCLDWEGNKASYYRYNNDGPYWQTYKEKPKKQKPSERIEEICINTGASSDCQRYYFAIKKYLDERLGEG